MDCRVVLKAAFPELMLPDELALLILIEWDSNPTQMESTRFEILNQRVNIVIFQHGFTLLSPGTFVHPDPLGLYCVTSPNLSLILQQYIHMLVKLF